MALRTRLVVFITGLVAVAASVSGVLSYSATRHEAIATIDDFLEVRSNGVRILPPPDSEFGPLPRRDGDAVVPRPGPPAGNVDPEGFPPPPFIDTIVDDDSIFGIIDPDGEIVVESDENVALLAASGLVPGETRFETTSIDGERFRVRTAMDPAGAQIVSARSLMETESTLGAVRVRLVLIAVVVILLAAVASWFAAGVLVRPLRRLNEAAESVATTGSLEAELDTDAGGEVGQLARSFTGMLSALRTSREQQQRLIADASHELRTPLTTVRANVDMLVSGRLDEADELKALGLIRSEVDELTNLTTELVELASADVIQPETSPLDVVSIVRTAVRREMQRHGREINVVSPTAGSIVIQGNAATFERAISNLVGNSIKFSEPGTNITVRVEKGSVAVVDQGMGIPEEDLGKIFERFYRADVARSLPGSGLGLSMVHETATAHGGHAFARNHPNGATVGFTFH